MSSESVMLPTQLILCHPFLLLCSVFPSIRVFSNESALHIRWPKYWRFSFSKSPSNEYSALIFFRMNWLDLLVQGTLKSLLQHHSSKASILWCSDFSMVQLPHPYMITEKTIALMILTVSMFASCLLLEGCLNAVPRVSLLHCQSDHVLPLLTVVSQLLVSFRVEAKGIREAQ